MSDKKKIIRNKDGIHVATIHGEFNIDMIANFFIKTPLKKYPKKENTEQNA